VPIDPITAAKGTGVAIAAATDRERRKWLADQWKKIRRALHSGKLGIAIFGSGGVGKSTLGAFLDEKYDPLAPPREYRSSVDTETFYLKTNDAQSLFVAAGQTERRQVSWSSIFDQLSKSKTLVLINTVAFGFHHSEQEINDFSSFQQERREIEISLFRELTETLKYRKAQIKILTVVLKQDLWKDKSDQVQDFYEKGDYKTILTELQNHIGEKNFHHEFLYVSLRSQNLKDKSNKNIALTVSGYDDFERHESQQKLLNLLAGWTK
jgi:GTPase SAR1 family protein